MTNLDHGKEKGEGEGAGNICRRKKAQN